MICKWECPCANCNGTIHEGDDVFIVENDVLLRKDKLCRYCAWLTGVICECGEKKKREHKFCWNCKVAQEEAEGYRCKCGAYKKPQYATCYNCKTEVTQ
jgi:hypothetical protein